MRAFSLHSPVTEPTERPSFIAALRFWLKLGLISFGGPAGQIAIMHEEVVVRRKWVTEEQFLHALNFCMLLPGPEAQQLATYLGWKLHGLRGGLAAGGLFILPSAFLLWALSWLSLAGGQEPWIAAIFHGLQPAVLAIVITALFRMGRKTLRGPGALMVALGVFLCLFLLHWPFPLVLLLAAAAGLCKAAFRGLPSPATTSPPTVPLRRLYPIGLLGIPLWVAPTLLAGGLLGWHSILVEQGIFFGKAALVTFGGAYAVLPYVAQQAVDHFGWLRPDQMMTGLGLAETTPGPLIMVLQYVGFAGAWQRPEGLSPLLAGTLGAAITTWTTFVPSFLFIFAAAPYLDQVRENRWIAGALGTITAAVVGVILNLAAWFLLHLFFPTGRVDWAAIGLTSLLLVALLRLRWSAPTVVLAGAGLGLVWHLALGF